MLESKRFTYTSHSGVMETITQGKGVWWVRRWRNGKREWWGSIFSSPCNVWEENEGTRRRLEALLTLEARTAFREWCEKMKKAL